MILSVSINIQSVGHFETNFLCKYFAPKDSFDDEKYDARSAVFLLLCLLDAEFLNIIFTQYFTAKNNVIVPHCKLHNDGSIDVSQDGTLLATYVPSTQGFPDNGHICVFSLRKENLGQCIYSRSYGMSFVLLF